MPNFGEFETYGEPLAVTDERGHVSTVWQARKAGGDNRLYVIKCYAPRIRATAPGQPEGALEKDRALEFLDGVKQIKKAQTEGGRSLAPIYDLGKTATEAWYVTDHYARNNLKAWIARRGGVDSGALSHVVRHVVDGCLALKRSRGYSHGNLKPSNVFLVGQPRPLKKTPLVLTDAFPAAPLQLAELDSGDKSEVGELLAQVVEAQDLRNLGELILQLVEGRLLARNDDYNYPIQRSSIWEILGKDADYWLKLCNQLVNPQLSLDTVSLETMARDFRPSDIGRKAALGAGVALGICILGGSGYLAVSRYLAHRRAAEALETQALTDWTTQTTAATACLNQTNFSCATDQFQAAKDSATKARNHSKETEAAQGLALAGLLAKAQQALTDNDPARALPSFESAAKDAKAFDGCARWIGAQAVPVAENYLRSGQPDLAEHWGNLALLVLPSDRAATDLSTRISQAKQNAQNFAGLLSSAKKAEGAGEFTNALSFYQQADKLKAGDLEVQAKLRELQPKADQQMQLVAQRLQSQKDRDNNFSAAVNSAQTFEQKGDFTNALAQYQKADQIKAGDTFVGTKLRELPGKAAAQVAAVGQQQQRMQDFQAAVSKAKSEEQAGNFTNALALYNRADLLKHGESDVTSKIAELTPKAKNQIEAERKRLEDRDGALRSASIAERDGNFTNALDSYKRAFGFDTNDTRIKSKIAELSPKAEAQIAKARDDAAKFKTEMDAAAAAELARNYTNALQHYQEAQKSNPTDPLVKSRIDDVTPKALQQRDAADARMKQLQEGAQNKQLAQAAEGTNAWAAALNYWQQAGRVFPDDTTISNSVAFTMGMTNALGRLEQASARTNTDPSEAINLCSSAADALRAVQDSATTPSRSRAVNNFNRQIADIRSAAQATIAMQSEQQDEKAAKAFFVSGDYAKAAALCQKHSDSPMFKTLASQVTEERDSLEGATNLFNQGIYSYLQTLSAKPYHTKPPFGPLFTKGTNEAAVLANLSTLKRDTNWARVHAVLTDPANKDFAGKASFLTYSQWADGMAKVEQNELDRAQRALEQCEFNTVQDIARAHGSAGNFAKLASDADMTRTRLASLLTLETNRDWKTLNAEWGQLDPALRQRKCFGEVKTWLDANDPCRVFDARVKAIKVRLGGLGVQEGPGVLDAVAPKPADQKLPAKLDKYPDGDWYRRLCDQIANDSKSYSCPNITKAELDAIKRSLDKRGL